ncbi:hypothetical protein TNCV_2752411 [Trichonephila clavipes]|nr:hypothetical protein TNCV_2752411 [Trichonephila clavipes]
MWKLKAPIAALSIPLERAMSPTGERSDEEGTSEPDRIRWDRKRGRRASAEQKYNESRLVDHARFNDETDNENHNDEIINGLLATFWIFFRCGQIIFRMADCEVEGTIASPLASPREGNVPDGEKERRRNTQNQENPLGPQERQTRIG